MAVMIYRTWSLHRLSRRLIEGSTVNVHRPKEYWRRWRLGHGRRTGTIRDGRVMATKLEGFQFGVEDGEEVAEGRDAGDHYREIFFDAEGKLLASLLEVREGFEGTQTWSEESF